MIPSPFQVVCYGEVLWDILPDKALPGGAPMNVAYHLKKLDVNPAMITRIGKDDRGSQLISLLSQNGLTTEFVQVDNTMQTGVVYAHLKEHNEMVYDIVKPVAWDFIEWNSAFTGLLTNAKYLVYGSLTSRNDVSRDTLYQVLDVAKTRVLDINLRPPHFNRPSVEYLLGKADILKMNNSELELISGWYTYLHQPEDRMKFLQERFNIETVIVTMGDEGAMLLDKDLVYSHPGYRVQVADTIGSGDAFLAGFISELIKGADCRQALSFACGAGALIASKPGGCPHYEASEIQAIMKTHSNHTPLKSII